MKHDTLTKNLVAIEGRALAKAMQAILAVIEKRNTYPILGSVKLAVSGPHLTLTGTDLDLELSVRLDVNEASGEWETCADPHILASIARQAGPALVTIWLAGKITDDLETKVDPELVVSIDNDTEYRLPCLDAERFPALPGERGDLIEEFASGQLVQLLNKVARYISTEETRYYLNGVCWQLRGFGRRFAATDGHRLGICHYDRIPWTNDADMIIPRKTVAIIKKAMAGLDVAAHAVAGKPALDLIAGPITIRTKLIEGTFPDIDRVTPKAESATHRIEANRQELLQAIDRTAVMRQRRGGTALRFFGKDDAMHVENNAIDHGKATARTRIAWPGGCSDFGLNATYVRDMVFDCDGNITFHVKDGNSPFLITDDDAQMTRVLMPMRV